MTKKYIAIIPARAGSKRLPGKNKKLLSGKPLIAWTIEAALQSTFIDEVIISTDDADIITITKGLGAKAPFVRPKELTSDTASSFDVLVHALNYVKNEGIEYQNVVFLQPTSPLRTAKHIDEACRLFEELEAKSVVSMTPAEHPIEWFGEIGSDLSLDAFFSSISLKRSQDYTTKFRINGAIYICQIRALLENKSFFFKSGSVAYIMDRLTSVDIDDEMDFKIAEYIQNEIVG